MPQTFAFFSFWYRNKMIRAQYGGNIFFTRILRGFHSFAVGNRSICRQNIKAKVKSQKYKKKITPWDTRAVGELFVTMSWRYKARMVWIPQR